MAQIYMDREGDTLVVVGGKATFCTEGGAPRKWTITWWCPGPNELGLYTLKAAVPDQKAREMAEEGLSWWEVLHQGR